MKPVVILVTIYCVPDTYVCQQGVLRVHAPMVGGRE